MNSSSQGIVAKVGAVFDLALVVDTAQAALCFAATEAGLLISKDRGRNWAQSHLSLAGHLVTSVGVSPDFPQDWTLLIGASDGVMFSADGGQSWNAGRIEVGSPQVGTLALSPSFAHDGVAMAGTFEDGILLSADRGRRWHPCNFGLLDLSVLALALAPAFEQNGTAFAGTTTGIFRSKNGGRAWRDGDLGAEVSVLSLAISPDFDRDGMVFAGTEEKGLFRCADRGTSWQRIASAQIDGPVNALAISPHFANDGMLLAGLDTGLYMSQDSGETWTLLVELPAVLCVAVWPEHSGLVLAGTAEDGIWYGVPGRQSWEQAAVAE